MTCRYFHVPADMSFGHPDRSAGSFHFLSHGDCPCDSFLYGVLRYAYVYRTLYVYYLNVIVLSAVFSVQCPCDLLFRCEVDMSGSE